MSTGHGKHRAGSRPVMRADGFAAELSARRHGPHDDAGTAGAARLAAEVVRFLDYATMPHADGLTEPATIYAITGELSSAVYRLPQLFGQLADWLTGAMNAGHLADDHGRPVHQLTDAARDVLAEAMGHADRLGRALAAAQSLTAGLHLAGGGDQR
jgi:hypothetical protein